MKTDNSTVLEVECPDCLGAKYVGVRTNSRWEDIADVTCGRCGGFGRVPADSVPLPDEAYCFECGEGRAVHQQDGHGVCELCMRPQVSKADDHGILVAS